MSTENIFLRFVLGSLATQKFECDDVVSSSLGGRDYRFLDVEDHVGEIISYMGCIGVS